MVNIGYSQSVLKDGKDSLSYSLGLMMANKMQGLDKSEVDIDLIFKGILHSLEKESLLIDSQEADKIYSIKLKEINSKLMEQRKQEGIDFLAKNATRAEVTSLPSGLQYEVIVDGSGESPTISDRVKTHYIGTLIDGTEFDSSVRRGEPLTFPLGNVIKAWQECLPLMKVGSKWKIYSPYNLAYGERQAGPHIKPYSTLIFEIELLAVNP